VTGLSVFVALFVGGVEVSQLLIQLLNLSGGVFDAIVRLNVANLGFVIVGAFVAAWVVSFAVFKLRRVEERWGALVEQA
ncbi:MAG TPA: HoxN/HupN/NixA family nickel/cobalt transporter, partial [Chloroflexota bacterium]|nr:HoxN/HupN/NixA family nickel/cobalt transporter [Chloroflexota bacterium]